MSTYNQAYYKANKEEIKEAQRRYYADNRESKKEYSKKYSLENKEKIRDYLQTTERKWRTYQVEAKKRSLAWDLTFEVFEEIFNLPCYYHGGSEPSRGIDRVVNDVGYVLANCVPCCHMCNLMKRGWSEEEFLARVREIASHFQRKS